MILAYNPDDQGPVISGYGGAVNQPIAPAPTGLTGTSTPSVPYTPITIQPPILLYPPPNIAPPAPPGTTGQPATPGATPASSPCGGCGGAKPPSTSTPSVPLATGAVRLADGVTLDAPAPTASATPFPWWWLVAAAVVGYAARGKRGR